MHMKKTNQSTTKQTYTSTRPTKANNNQQQNPTKDSTNIWIWRRFNALRTKKQTRIQQPTQKKPTRTSLKHSTSRWRWRETIPDNTHIHEHTFDKRQQNQQIYPDNFQQTHEDEETYSIPNNTNRHKHAN